MNITRFVFVISLLVVLSILATGCSPSEPAGLTNDEISTLTQNILTAIDTGDYPTFTLDFSSEMLTGFPEDQFTQLRDLLHSASGNFVSVGELSLSNKQEFALYRIICKYALEDVVVTIVFKIDGKQVEGLFFDSPNLRSASK